MEVQAFVTDLVTEANRNARVIDVTETQDIYRVRIAGTTTVVTACDIPRNVVTEAAERPTVRRRLLAVLKRCADETVAPMPDGRG